MYPTIWLDGPPDIISAAIAAAGPEVVYALPASLLVTMRTDADAVIANAHKFANAVPSDQDALLVNILHTDKTDDWPTARTAALLWGFTRYAALAWAPRRIRVNAIGLGVSRVLPNQRSEASGQAAVAAPAVPAAPADIAATILAMWRFPSMTGQIIRLGAP